MPRPCKSRLVGKPPAITAFGPIDTPVTADQAIELRLDELEALRLADVEGLYQDAAAGLMDVSRPTFGRLLQAARHKSAIALVTGSKLVIRGGETVAADARPYACGQCRRRFRMRAGRGDPSQCPACDSPSVARADDEQTEQRRCQGPGPGTQGEPRGCRPRQRPADSTAGTDASADGEGE